MSDAKTVHEKISSLGANISNNVNEALHDARPVMDRVAHRVKDDLQHMSASGQDVAMDAKHKLEREVRHLRDNAEHYIQHQPINAVLVAAGTGALTALAVSWLLQSRKY